MQHLDNSRQQYINYLTLAHITLSYLTTGTINEYTISCNNTISAWRWLANLTTVMHNFMLL